MRLIAIPGAALLLLVPVACAPRATPLRGAVAPARLPSTALPPVHRKIVFHWSYRDREFRASGDGAARISPPDSVRLDLFVGEGVSGGAAVLIDQQLRTSGDRKVRDYLPPVPLLWASLGRLSVPPARDTTARVAGDTLRVDIGHDPRWRGIFIGDTLHRLELIDGDRIRQWMSRQGAQVHYQQVRARRTLDLTITRVDTVPGFDATIWQ